MGLGAPGTPLWCLPPLFRPSRTKQVKYLQVESYHEELEILHSYGQEYNRKTTKKFNDLPKNRKEEKTFWGRILNKETEIVQLINSKFQQAKRVLQLYGERFGATKGEKAGKKCNIYVH